MRKIRIRVYRTGRRVWPEVKLWWSRLPKRFSPFDQTPFEYNGGPGKPGGWYGRLWCYWGRWINVQIHVHEPRK